MATMFCCKCGELFDENDLIFLEQNGFQFWVCPDCYEEYFFNEDDYIGGNDE